jgi:hypothetical protein
MAPRSGDAPLLVPRSVVAGIVLAWASACVIASCAIPGISMGDSGAAVDSSGSGEDAGAETSGRSLFGCNIKNVGDIADCPGNCNAAIEGAEGVYQCTVTCNEVEQDCGEGWFCQVFQDGGTACLEDCSQARICTNGNDACDDVLSVCLPQSTTSSGDGDGDGDDGSDAVEVSTTCDFDAVESTDDCDDDCDNPVYTGDGFYVCTTECDIEEQDCPGPKYRCEEVDDGTGACFLDCTGGNACPGDDYACDEDLELCIPVR